METPANVTNTSALVKAKVAHIGGAATYQTGFVYSDHQDMPSLENGATKVLGTNTSERNSSTNSPTLPQPSVISCVLL